MTSKSQKIHKQNKNKEQKQNKHKKKDIKENEQEKLFKYYKWYEQQYGQITGLDQLQKDKRLPNWLHVSLKKFPYPFSSIWRHNVLEILKYTMLTRKTEYICTIFRMSRLIKIPSKDRTIMFSSNYGYLYSYIAPKEVKKMSTSHSTQSQINHEYMCTSPTFRSCDGEYRHRFLQYKQIMRIYKKNMDVFEQIEKYLLQKIKSNEIILSTEFIYPDYIKKNANFEKIVDIFINQIDKKRLALIIFASAWIIEIERFITGKSENHLVVGYQQAMFDEEGKQLYHKIHQQIGSVKYAHIVSELTQIFRTEKQTASLIECGQKIFPLKVKEVENYGNIINLPWRELYILSQTGDLVVNGICPSLALLGGWFFIQSTQQGLFDNKITHIKLKHSQIAHKITTKLKKAQRKTYQSSSTEFLSFDMEGLSEAIEIPVDYAEEKLVMSDITMVLLMEHLGRTIADVPKLITFKDYRLESGPLFEKYEVFAKYAFEFIYTLYCLNSKLQIIHGDLHLNNVVLYIKHPLFDINANLLIDNPHILYVLNQEDIMNNIYIFKHYGRYAGIIDFSRGIIGREKLEKDFSSHDASQYIIDQRRRILHIYKKELPEFVEANEARIDILMLKNFDLAFKLFTAIDSYKLSKGLLVLIENNAKGPDKSKMISLVKKINKIALSFIQDKMFQATEERLFTLEYPNLTILKECFSEFTLANKSDVYSKKDIRIVDIFTYTNELKYNIREYDKFPPTAKWDYILKHNIEKDMGSYFEWKDYLKYEKNELRDIDMISKRLQKKIQKKDKPKKEGKPPKKSNKTDKKEDDIIICPISSESES